MTARGLPVRLLGAAVVTVALLAGLAALSQAPYAHAPPGRAELRLAWRARSLRIEACRRLTTEELARLPPHMRHPLDCRPAVAPYRLRVTLDDSVVVDRLVTAAGARADRPLYVLEQFRLAPGTHGLGVVFSRQSGGPDEAESEAEEAMEQQTGEEEQEMEAARRAAPQRLVLDTTVVLAAGRAALVTYDEDTRRLTLVIEQ